MKAPLIPTSLLPDRVRGLFHKQNTVDYTPMPPIHDDLGGLTSIEIAQEISVVERRIELGVVQPEGADGLQYRLSRLQAQQKALEKRNNEQQQRRL